ncbi:hypothetical protein MUO79_07670 [Candidatus Bathyarchaeota archaeon]|nr:hypothetical protein [Candidatus Bathyarchaeota archaeon]
MPAYQWPTVNIATPTAVLNGQVTLTGTPARDQLAAVATPIKSVTIENPATNAVVYVGNNAVVVANGYRLQPGATVSLDIDDLNKVNVTGTAGNVVSYIAVN